VGSSLLRVDAVDAMIAARPGTTVPCVVRVHNDGPTHVSLSVRVVGIGFAMQPLAVPWQPLGPGETLDVVVPVVVPEAIAAGEHAVAIEVGMLASLPGAADGVPRATPGRRPVKPTLAMAPLVVKVGSLDQVLLRTNPSVIRGRFGKRFDVEVINKRDETIQVDLSATAAHLSVQLDDATVTVPAGATAVVPAALRGRSHWFGEDHQHVVNVEARGSALPAYTRLVYRQRPIVARGVRGAVAALLLLGLWAGILGGAAFWISNRNNDSTAEMVDKNGDGLPDLPGTGAGTDTGTDGGSGTGTDGGSGGGGSAGAPPGTDAAAVSAPTSTLVRGVVKAGGTGDDGGVVITLTPLVAQSEPAAADAGTSATAGTTAATPGLTHHRDWSDPVALAGGLAGAFASSLSEPAVAVGSTTGGKFWSARYGAYAGSALVTDRATVSITADSGADGSWLIGDVPLRRTYEVSFSKPGFDRQSFQILPPDDGKPVELDVELQPASGALGGVISGPSGPLGGVELTVTDGTLVFSATTSTDPASRGTWLIEGLGTPATYSVTAVLDGFGTAVAQVPLAVGERRTNLAFTMQAGVGSIGGRVRGDSGPLGGVTLTAAGSGVSRNTTSLTAGDTGAFLFPGLDIPGEYTVTASAPGYITQTRLVPTTGNVTGIDIELVRTTASIAGVVASITAPGATQMLPLPNASVEIAVDGLRVRTTTAVSPDPGSFDLGSIPPGTYTLTFGRYDHVSDSRLVTLSAGQVLDLGAVPLVYQPREELSPTGSLSVSVIAANSSPVTGLTLATIQVSDVSGRIAGRTKVLEGNATSFTFTDMPIGTYRVLVTKENYRPYELPRETVGRSNTDITAPLLKFGQAFGQVIDGMAPKQTFDGTLMAGLPLNDYRLLLYELTDGVGQPECAGTLTVAPGVVKVGGQITWSVSLEQQLLSGTYVLRFEPVAGDTDQRCAPGGRVPPGYAAVADVNGNVGSFVIPPDNDDPVRVPDIAVFPYPRLAGVVLAPVWNTTTDAVELVPATALAAGLSLTLVCGARQRAVPASVAGGVVVFSLSRTEIAAMFGFSVVPAGGLLGDCRLKATAPGYVPVDRALPGPFTINTDPAVGYDSRSVAIVMTDSPDDLTGTALWTDAGDTGATAVHLISGVQVAADGALVGFTLGQAIDTDGPGPTTVVPASPEGTPVNINATSGDAGVWAFLQPGQQQIAGESTYDVTATSFESASFVLRVEDGGRTLVSSTGFTSPVVDTGSLQLELAPLPGSITGEVQIITGSAVDRAAGALVVATPPGGTAINVPVANGSYTIADAAAGTWQLDYRQVAGSNLIAAPLQTAVSPYVAPDTVTPVADATYWDLGEVKVAFTDTNNDLVDVYTQNDIQYPRAGLTQTTAVTSYPAWTDRAVAADAAGLVTFGQLSVDEAVPVGTDIGYTLTVQAPGYDLTTAAYDVFVEGVTDPISGVDPSTIQLAVAAGTRIRVEVELPPFGSISGAVRGLLRPPSTVAADVEPLDLNTTLHITYQRVADAAGTDLVPVGEVRTATRVDGAVPGYTMVLAAGFYRVTYSADDFVTKEVVYDLGIGELATRNVDLDIARGRFTLSVITDEVSDTSVDAASVRLWPAGTLLSQTETVVPSYVGTTSATGTVDFDPEAVPAAGIIPGAYLVIVRKADVNNPDRDGFFPVIATVSVPRGPDAAARTIVRRAVMPRTQGSIIGTVFAENTEGRAVPLPATFIVARTFDVPQATGTDGLPNDATEQDRIEDNVNGVPVAAITFAPDPDETSIGYGFTGVAGGVHTLSFTAADGGYEPIANLDVVADQVGPTTAADVTFVAQNVTWLVTLTDGTAPVSGLILRATAPGGSTPSLTANEVSGTPGTYKFTDVLPETDPYTLVFDSEYYRFGDAVSPNVIVRPNGAAQTTPPKLLVGRAIIQGTATKALAASATGFVTEADSVALLDGGGNVLQTADPDAAGAYQFSVESTQAVTIRATVAGFKPATVNPGTIVLGTTITVPTAVVQQLASAIITVSGVTAGANVTVAPSTGVTVSAAAPAFTFTGLDPTVDYTFTATATNAISKALAHDPDVGGSFTSTIAIEALRTLSGTVTKNLLPVPGAAVELRLGAAVIGTTSSDSAGAFTFSGVGYGTFTIAAELFRTGAGSLTGVLVDVGGATGLVDLDVPIAARTVRVTFVVTSGSATPTVTVNGATGAAGVLAFNVPEDGSFDYSVSAPGYLSLTGTLNLGSTYSATFITPTIALLANAVAGSVTGLSGSASVRLCTAANMATAAACYLDSFRSALAVGNSNANFSFARVAPGTYGIVVRKGSGSSATYSAVVTVTVAADGTVTPSSVTVASP